MITTVPCKVMFPKSYLTGSLGSVDEHFNVIGIFAIIMGDKYGFSNAASIMPLSPDTTNVVTIDEVQYMELGWEAGSVICPNVNLIKADHVVSQIFDEFIAKGRDPWYTTYTDHVKILWSTAKYAGVNLKAPKSILSVFASSRARVEGDLSSYFRETLKTQADLAKAKPLMIALRNIAYGATNTTARISGAYLDSGINSALINPAKESEAFEESLRK